MTDDFNDFRAPTLHLVIADDVEHWRVELDEFFRARIEEWSLHRTGQFHFESHFCGSYEEFTETTDGLLRTGDLVYATADLLMPLHKGGEVPDSSVWQKLILWCLDRVHDSSGVGNRFEFCVISGEPQMLDGLFKHPRHGAVLHRKGIKRAYKDQIEKDKNLALRKIWEDVRAFVLGHIRFCTVPETGGGPTQTMVWFGGNEALFRLLERTDEIARREPKGDFYVAFADACGYEEDWFRLCCHLKGIERPKIDNFAELPPRDEGWQRDLQDPPKALLLSQIDGGSKSHGFDIHQSLEDGQFFRALDAAGAFACFQFPNLQTDLDAERLEPKERELLRACFARVYGHSGPFDQGGSSHYRDSDHIIRFPKYETMKAAGVVRATIAFRVKEYKAEYNLKGVSVDPEVVEILAEIPWNETLGGLDQLSVEIRNAYKNASARRAEIMRYIDLGFFAKKGPVYEHFGSSRGFAIRGRRLVRLLDQQWPGGSSTMPTTEMDHEEGFRVALAGLEQIQELFQSLQHLMDLASQLQEGQRRIEFPPDFPLADFEALRAAHEFLFRIFISPAALRGRIDEFRRHEKDRGWQDYYPTLESGEDRRELIEHLKFTWPYGKFRLPTPINDYLISNGVIAEIYREMERVLPRHPDIEEKWRDLDRRRRALEEDLQEREVQRRAAQRYAREASSQPVLLLLGLPAEHKRSFIGTLQSFFFFNAFIAVCENFYRFGKQFCGKEEANNLLKQPQLGAASTFLINYLGRLKTAGRLQESVFRGWVDDWPEAAKQSDATRVFARIADRTITNPEFSKALSLDEQAIARRLSDSAQSPHSCSIKDVLEFMRILRNTFDKGQMQAFYDAQITDIWDALRRFVAATTHTDFRFGRVSEDGNQSLLWARDRLEESEAVPQSAEYRGRECAFVRSDHAEHYCFPIDDVIRLNPSDYSPFAFYSGDRWLNLGIDGVPMAQMASPWLPKKEEREMSAIWMWAKSGGKGDADSDVKGMP